MELNDQLDPAFSRRNWRVQRIGWVLMVLVVIGSVAGLFGTGLLSSGTVEGSLAGGRVEVEHPRVSRYQHVDVMHIRVDAPQAQGNELRIAFSQEFVENFVVRGSTPPADGGGARAGAGVFVYQVEDWSRPFTITFEIEPQKTLRIAATVTVAAGNATSAALPLDAFVYP